MPCAAGVFRGEVIHGRKIIEFGLHCMGRNAVCDLCRRIIIQRRIARHHAAKQCDIDRRGIKQRCLVSFVLALAGDRQCCQRLRLFFAHKEQHIAHFILIYLDAGFLQRLGCHFFCIFFRDCRVLRPDRIADHLQHALGALTQHAFIENLPEHQAHRTFPSLGRNTGAHRAAINGGFRTAGVIPVHAAGRYGLQNMKIHIQSVVHSHC